MASPHTTEKPTTVAPSVAEWGLMTQATSALSQYLLQGMVIGRAEPCSRCAEQLAAFVQHAMMHVPVVERHTLTSVKQESPQSVEG